MWDILGKVVNRPVYKLLGGTKTACWPMPVRRLTPPLRDGSTKRSGCKQQGYKAYKLHPFGLKRKPGSETAAYLGHIELIKAIRKAVGDDFLLAYDPIMAYNVPEAHESGPRARRAGLRVVRGPGAHHRYGRSDRGEPRFLNIPLQVGEYLSSISDFAEYIHRGALDSVRLIADKVGGISGSMRVGMLADAFNMDCTPHNFGNTAEQAVHFHLELAMPNAFWFEMGFRSRILTGRITSKNYASIRTDMSPRLRSRDSAMRSITTRSTGF
jgi:L-alanine-DL-glutamate epimerase-like enolase superfamily enzyme